jgi:hypothetical protein
MAKFYTEVDDEFGPELGAIEDEYGDDAAVDDEFPIIH